jgi:CO/xanthine dehydrogenase Mo-binding subunit
MVDHTDTEASLVDYPNVDDWLRFDENKRVTVRTGKIDIGQRITTALALIAAEELDIDYERIDIDKMDTAYALNEEYTSASNSIERSGLSLRRAAATARRHLLRLASVALATDIDTLEVNDGTISSRDSNRTVTYWELLSPRGFGIPVDPSIATKPSQKYRVIGRKKLVARDLPELVSGTAPFVHDMDMPGMLHARVVRPPHEGVRLTNPEALPKPADGVVVRNGNFLAVACADEYGAIKLAEQVRTRCKWTIEVEANRKDIFEQLLTNRRISLPVNSDGASFDPVPELTPPPEHAAATFNARLRRPYLMHGSIGPSAALGHFEGGKLTIWSHSQGVFQLRLTLAEALRIEPNNIRVIHVRGPGTYGHNGADDAALDAALVALAVPGRPVLLKWTRADEHGWEPFGPAMVVDIRASIDGDGKIIDWSHETFSGTHRTRPRPQPNQAGPKRLLATHHVENPLPPFVPEPALSGPMAGIHRGAFPYYEIPRPRVVKHLVHDLPLRTSALRTLGSMLNVAAIEIMMDQLAEAAGEDVIDYRLAYLNDSRAKDVIRAVAESAGWKGQRRRREGHGRGFAFARYNNRKAYAAVIADIYIGDDADMRFQNITIAVDAGQVIDHEGLSLQIEGGVLQAASWMRYEEVLFEGNEVISRDWDTYPIIRFDNVPNIDVILLDRPDMKPLGPSECALSPTGAAIANAVYDAVGLRLTQTPYTPAAIRKAAME